MEQYYAPLIIIGFGSSNRPANCLGDGPCRVLAHELRYIFPHPSTSMQYFDGFAPG